VLKINATPFRKTKKITFALPDKVPEIF